MKERHPQRRFWLLLGAFAAFVVVALFAWGRWAQPARGATLFVVTKTADSNDGVCDADCSLREAIGSANALPGADTITVPAGTYALSIPGASEDANASGDLDVTDDVTISGAAAANTIVDGGGMDRVFDLHNGFSANISGLTIRNGSATYGGGVYVDLGTLSLTDTTVSGNTATYGGGTYSAGAVTMDRSTVSGNSADQGGGIDAEQGTTMMLTDSTVSGNTANNYGGGILSRGALTLNNSTVVGNSAPNNNGGGILVDQGTLMLTDSTVSNNTAAYAGGISNAGGVTMDRSTVSGNTATFGGGVYNVGTVTMTTSTVSGNTALYGGGGVYNTGALTISNSTLSSNSTSSGDGGGISARQGTLMLTDSTVSGNTALSNAGGGISVALGVTATLTTSTVSGNTSDSGGGILSLGALAMNNSTVSANTATNYGGGVYSSGVVTMDNSTVSGNTAYVGGGVYSVYGALTISNSTVSANTASNYGAGIYTAAGPATATYTIIAENSNGDCSGSLTSAGHNLDSDGTCGLGAGGDLANITNPELVPLALNSPGGTETHALCTGPGAPVPSCTAASSAKDAGGNDCPPPATDQRGVARPQGAACDIGAYEAEPPPPTPTPTPTNSLTPASTPTITLTPSSTGSCVNPPPGLAGWWPLDETTGATVVTDISGGGHNGIPHTLAVGSNDGPRPGASPQVVPPAEVGGSLYFYTQRTYIRVPHATKLEPGGGDFSIDTWVYPAPVGPGFVQPVVDKFDPGSNFGYALYIQSPSIANNARLNFVYGDGSLLSVQSSAPIAYSQWHHVAVTVKRTPSPPPGGKYLEVQLYVDGAPQGNQQVSNPVGSIANSLELFIGGTRMSPLPGFGEIALDEVQMFDRTLSPAEILDIYNADGSGKCRPGTPTPTATPTRTPTPTPGKQCGDVNDDGTVNAIDALAMLQYIAGLTPALQNLPSADVNGDGTLNALDVLLVLQYSAGLVPSLPC